MPTADPVETSTPPSETTSGLRPRRLHWTAVVVLASFAALSARLLALISHYAVNVFFMDQWDYNEATLFERHSWWQMFRWQHGPHRQGLGAIVAYVFDPPLHWNSRSESFLIGVIVLIATICALWLKIRLFGTIAIFDVCIPLILLTPLQYETLVITPNFAHGPLPLLLVLVFCLAWTVPNPPWRYSLILLLNFLAIHTGFGLFLGVITPVALAADYWLNRKEHPSRAILSGISSLVSLASLAFFFVNYKYETSVDCSPNLLRAPAVFVQFLFLMFANLFGVKGSGFLPLLAGGLTGAAILAALIASAVTLACGNRADRAKRWTAAILLSFCLLFSADASYGRSCLGPQVAQVSRYVIYMDLGLLGLYFFLLSLPQMVARRILLSFLTIALLASIPIRKQDESVLRFVSSAKSNWKACYLQKADIRACNHAVGYGVYPNTDRNLKGKLEFLKHSKQNLYSGE
jgi:hypothetical protein